MKHRILIFSLAYYPHVGGAEIALKEITDRISDVEFHMVTLNFGGEAKEEKIGTIFVHRVGNSSSYFQKILFIPRAAAAAARLHRKHQFDAFWAMMSYMLFPIVLLRFMDLRNPYLLTLQEGDPWEHMFSRWFILPFRPLLKSGFKNVTAVQAISTYLGKWARRMGYQGEVSVVPNGVDTKHFADAMAIDIGKKENEIWLIHTGRLVHKNSLDVVIHALSLLPNHVHFFMIGDGPEKKKLASLANELGVSSRVHFHSYVPNEDLPNYLKICDIFIRPSRSEGMGNSFIEAMAAGLPVIATQEGGIADFLFDEKRNPDKETTGWAVDKDSPEQVAEAVKDILARPEQAAHVIANAKKLVSENYDWDGIAEKISNIFGVIFV